MPKSIKDWFLKQHDLGLHLGGLKDLAQRTLFYVTAINFVLLVITTFSVSQFINRVSFPVFVAILAVVLLLAMVLEYKFILPSTWRFINKQRYEHGEPLKDDLQKVLDGQSALSSRLKRIEKKLEIESGDDK